MADNDNTTDGAKNGKLDRIVWVDCEMTGLDPDTHVIVEIAALVTDSDLNILGEGVDVVVHASDEELAKMDDFVTNMHASSGLTEEIRNSTVSLAEAEARVLEYIRQWVDQPRTAPLAGNSIAADRGFIRSSMPDLEEFLHYRMIDVSSIKELTRRWMPEVYFRKPEKGMSHRALVDIKESIRELDYYRRAAFAPAPGPTADEANEAAEEAVDRFPL